MSAALTPRSAMTRLMRCPMCIEGECHFVVKQYLRSVLCNAKVLNMNLKTWCDQKAGREPALAAAVNVAVPYMWQMVRGKRPVPAAYCSAIEVATGGEVTRQELRPKDFHLIWPEIGVVGGAAVAAQPA